MRGLHSAGRGIASSGAGLGLAVGGVMGAARSLALTGAGAGVAGGWLFKRQFIDSAASFERYEAILKTITGSSEEARKSMEWIGKFSEKTPYRIGDLTESFARLKAYGLDPIKGNLLETLGDTGAALGKPVDQVMEAIVDAMTGENERLKELNIRGAVKNGVVTYSYADKEGKTKTKQALLNDRKMIQATLQGIWAELYKGAMKDQRETFGGLVSQLFNKWDLFKKSVMDSGPFEKIKGKLRGFLNQIGKWEKDGTLKKWAEIVAEKINRVIDSAERLGRTLVFDIAPKVKSAIDYLGGFKTVATGAALVVGGPLIGALLKVISPVARLGFWTLKGAWSFGKLIYSITPFKRVFGPVLKGLRLLPGAIMVVSRALWGLLIASGPIGWTIMAASTAFLALYNSLDQVGKSEMWNGILEDVNKLISAFKELKSVTEDPFGSIKRFGWKVAEGLNLADTDDEFRRKAHGKIDPWWEKNPEAQRIRKSIEEDSKKRQERKERLPRLEIPPPLLSRGSSTVNTVNNNQRFAVTIHATPNQNPKEIVDELEGRYKRLSGEYSFITGSLRD